MTPISPRCGTETIGTIMSKFNTEEICFDCRNDEQHAPGYQAADAAEIAACRSGDYNFPVVGLSSEDRTFLAERVRQRKAR